MPETAAVSSRRVRASAVRCLEAKGSLNVALACGPPSRGAHGSDAADS